MRIIAHEGEAWHATPVGTSYFADSQDNMRVRFWSSTNNREVFGRLPGVANEDFDKATDEQLRVSLVGALSPDEG
jgi:hypothetical protein